MRKIKILILIFMALMFTACETQFIMPTLPDYKPIRPTVPTLETVEEEVPMNAVINTVKLMSYAEQLEAYADGWETFYGELEDEWN